MKSCLLLLLLLPLLLPLMMIVSHHVPRRKLENFLDDWFGDPWKAKERQRAREAVRGKKPREAPCVPGATEKTKGVAGAPAPHSVFQRPTHNLRQHFSPSLNPRRKLLH